MNAGSSLSRRLRAGCLAAILQAAVPALAIDNPDAPDVVAAFELRARGYEERVQNAENNARLAEALLEYEHFLDTQLNYAYSGLLQHLTGDTRQSLIGSQRRWIQYRDAEFAFIAANWTAARFGTSYLLTRGMSRNLILRSRAIELLNYLRNYPATPGAVR